jgi:hypothetical protein
MFDQNTPLIDVSGARSPTTYACQQTIAPAWSLKSSIMFCSTRPWTVLYLQALDSGWVAVASSLLTRFFPLVGSLVRHLIHQPILHHPPSTTLICPHHVFLVGRDRSCCSGDIPQHDSLLWACHGNVAFWYLTSHMRLFLLPRSCSHHRRIPCLSQYHFLDPQ